MFMSLAVAVGSDGSFGPKEEGICSLLSGNIAVLSTVEVLLLRKKEKKEIGWSLPHKWNLQKQSS